MQFNLSRETMTVSLALEISPKSELKQRKKLDRDVLKSKDILLPEINTIPRYFILLDHGIEIKILVAKSFVGFACSHMLFIRLLT